MEPAQVVISRAEGSALEKVLLLLVTVDLPHDGATEHLGGFLIARDDARRLVGCIGMERHDRLGLLRLAHVAPWLQWSGLGTRLTEAILQDAAWQGLSEV